MRTTGGRRMGARVRLAAVAVLAGSCLMSASIAAAANRPANTGRQLNLVLPFRVNEVGLKRFATAVSNPRSPLYGQYESIPMLAKRFGASRSIRVKTLRYLRAHGAADVKVDAT